MSENIQQVFITNPITTNVSTDLMYFGRAPYNPSDDAAMTYANFSAQFGAPYTPSALNANSDTNVTITLGGSPLTALLSATTITMGWFGQLSPDRGGSGVNNGTNTFTIGGNFQMSGGFTFNGMLTANTNVIFPTSGTLATTSQIPTGAPLTTVNDTNITLTLGGSPTTALINATSITPGWDGVLSVERGGLESSAIPSNGQIPIGNGSTYTPNTLFGGTGIQIINNPGSITIQSTGAGPWVEVTGPTAAMTANTGYTANNVLVITLGLPTSAAVGDYVIVQGFGAGGWIIAQSAGQQIFYGNALTTPGVTGGLTSTHRADSVTLRCATNGGLFWTAVASQGEINTF